jgi:hypothetical protein
MIKTGPFCHPEEVRQPEWRTDEGSRYLLDFKNAEALLEVYPERRNAEVLRYAQDDKRKAHDDI